MSADQNGLIASLDIGSSKVACLIAQVGPGNDIQVLGVGNRACPGMKNGAVVDPFAVETAVKAAMDQAEHMAEAKVDHVFVSLAAGNPKSRILEVDLSLDGHEVSQADINRIMTQARAEIDGDGGRVLHAFPASYGLDGRFNVKPPVGLSGDKLSVAMHVITVDDPPAHNLERVVERAHLRSSDLVSAPYANGLAVLDANEVRLGTTCIDIGGGTTEISMFAEGAMVHQMVLPWGSDQLTDIIARTLLTPYENAEYLKTFGSAIVSAADERSNIDVAQVGENDLDDETYVQIPRSELTTLMQKYFEDLFFQIKGHLEDTGLVNIAAQQIVLTGGAAECESVADLASGILGKRVRIGVPRSVQGLPEMALKPQFATAVGLLHYAVRAPREANNKTHKGITEEPKNLLGRLGNWFRSEF